MSLGAPLDLFITLQLNVARFVLDKYVPSHSRWLLDWTSEYRSKKSFKFDPSWRLSPAPSLANHQPTISDTLVDSLWAGDITSVYGLRRFIAGNKVELDDGTILEVDAVVLCTGYEPGFSLTPDFSLLEQGAGKEAGINHAPLARLYQNIFPPKYADSWLIRTTSQSQEVATLSAPT
jgi:dimethylaniline monooxygenase (N-oxide forming)